MIHFAITAQEFWQQGKEWVESVGLVIDITIAKISVLGLAAIGAWKTLRSNVQIQAVKEEVKAQIQTVKEDANARLDQQAQRINTVALAAAPAANGKPETDLAHETPASAEATAGRHE